MWIVRLALARPYTFIVLALLLFLIAPLIVLRTPTDIFPAINIPVVSVVWTYTGLAPTEMAERITAPYERGLTTLVSNIEHIESQSLNGVSVIKVFLNPSGSVDQAIPEAVAEAQVLLKQLPPGLTPPLVIAYNASSVPVLQLGLSGQGLTEQQLNDFGVNFIRPALATVEGASIPLPYGGKVRQIMVDIDSHLLVSKGLSPMDVVNAINAQNIVLPSGTIKIGALEYNVALNATPASIEELNHVPVASIGGSIIRLRDVAHVRDGYAVQQNVVRQDGQRGALLTVQKSGNASTLSIVAAIRAALPKIGATLPPALEIRPLFDQSLFIRASLQGVVREALIAAALTAAMILLFLGSWRSTLIIAVSIPLSILSSLTILSALGETINIMTLGGFALSVGILVDDATVTIENVRRHLAMGKEVRQAILDDAQQVAVPAFVSTLSISIVFVPMFLLTGVARFLFVPLAEAVVFALWSSYFLSRTLVPTLMLYLIEAERRAAGRRPGAFARLHERFERGFDALRERYAALLGLCLESRGRFTALFLLLCLVSLLLLPLLGRDFFPAVDAGQFQLHMRAKTGTRIEETAKLADQVENEIRRLIPAAELGGILDNIGLPTSGINLTYSNSGTVGTMDAQIGVSLKPEHSPTPDYVSLLRERLPKAFPGTSFYFQPADIVSQILNFGLPAAIDVQLAGADVNANFAAASRIAERMRAVPGAVDVRIQQAVDQPLLRIDVDRIKAEGIGLAERDVANAVLTSLSSSLQTSPSYWLDPANGVVYPLAVQTPQYAIDSIDSLRSLPVSLPGNAAAPQLLTNLTTMQLTAEPAVVSHYDIRPVVDVYANVEGRDLAGVAADIRRITSAEGSKLPRGSGLVMRGQVATMRSSFFGLFYGLFFSIALVYLLIVVNFQSWTEALIIISALPAALAGICWMLYLTRTTLSVPAMMGTIMSMGVATANSVLVITFANERFLETKDGLRAALEAGSTRLRPVVMTALAMIIGMAPMALGLGEGGEQNAPLGRAVIGGLLFATAATLFFVPAVFAVIHKERT